MSVIVGRALPDARDGLKPVHRRVLFAMHELNNDWNRPYKKSARIVGDVIGKYHPHGDQSVYDTHRAHGAGLLDAPHAGRRPGQLRLGRRRQRRGDALHRDPPGEDRARDARRSSTRRPSTSARTTTAARRSRWSCRRKLPNLLVNGSGGIAVGMATNIPPHNLNEVVDACLHLLRNPEATIDELMEIIPAPDFPTAGIIYGLGGVREGYRTGRGQVVMRAKCHFEDIDKGQRQAIIVDEIPYQVNKKTLLERMAELVHEKKLEGISHIQDESDKSGMRVVIELKRGEVPEVVLNNLYKQTQLQDTFGINMVALIDGQPKLCNLKDLIEIFLEHRREVVTRRTVFDAAQGARARPRARRPGGRAGQHRRVHRDHQDLADAAGRQDRADEPRAGTRRLVREMLARVGERDGAAAATPTGPRACRPTSACRPTACTASPTTRPQEILQMRLQRLTGLEQDKIVGEYKEVMAEIADLLDILADAGARHDHHRRRARRAEAGVRPDQARRAPQRDRAQRARPRHRGPDHADRHGRDALAHRLHQEPAARPNTARRSAAAAASRRRRPRKTTGSTSSSSPTRTTTSSASPTAAASTGSRSGKCRRARAARAAGRSSTCSRCSPARRSTSCCR